MAFDKNSCCNKLKNLRYYNYKALHSLRLFRRSRNYDFKIIICSKDICDIFSRYLRYFGNDLYLYKNFIYQVQADINNARKFLQTDLQISIIYVSYVLELRWYTKFFLLIMFDRSRRKLTKSCEHC